MEIFTAAEIEKEVNRLFSKLESNNFTLDLCRVYAPITLEINKLKKQRNAVILAHTYQTPDIIFGVADYVGDSLKLSIDATRTKADIILFAGVKFMAETAKILNPSKKVFIPSHGAGCSLADGITAENVRSLKKKHPGLKAICYVNTSADVKAECDVCCTSANAEKIIRAIDDPEYIFVPDRYMAENLEKITGKKLHSWDSKCIVHEIFTEQSLDEWKSRYPDVKVLAHVECTAPVIAKSDYVGGTEGMAKFVSTSTSKRFMLITECGLSERLRAEFPDKEFVGTCNLCPYMKMNNLLNILDTLKRLPESNEVTFPVDIIVKARIPVERMLELSK